MQNLRMCHLYPETLNLYGDEGNVTTILRRCEKRGISAEVSHVNLGDTLNWEDYDLFLIGGGQDFEQSLLMKDLTAGKGEAITKAVEAGKTFLTICAGYQLMGQSYETWDGSTMDFIGALDFKTLGRKKRLIGNYLFETDIHGQPYKIVGFENHSGQTFLGENVRALGKVLVGNGNNEEDATEGVRYKNVFGSYSHGPILPKNPRFADYLIETALTERYGGPVELVDLDDHFENAAHKYMVDRLLK